MPQSIIHQTFTTTEKAIAYAKSCGYFIGNGTGKASGCIVADAPNKEPIVLLMENYLISNANNITIDDQYHFKWVFQSELCVIYMT